MYRGLRILALIPARGGSKGLPGKNLKALLGKPLLAWSIGHGRASRYVDQVLVSTDDEQIARVGRQYKARVPFIRPVRLATDKAKSIDVILHALDFLEERGEHFDLLVLLEPTSPLREAKDIDRAIEQLVKDPNDARSIVGVSRVGATNPAFDAWINGKNFLRPYERGFARSLRRQDLKDLYYFEGSLYVSYTQDLRQRESFYHNKTLPYIVPKWQAFEVDDIVDFICVEAMMRNLSKIKKGMVKHE